ncbi:enoyl-CoA hydratase [Listeria floridensis FSL S10-1187]|uniref:Enoyl-CoA hydratase n=2 Tax=Listeria floridensis TaxID=1494962 RepID=A0ABN0RBS3_9LIST|nr:enoyl-CoA hydratase [Listeria floridensis FSL S10-1187]
MALVEWVSGGDGIAVITINRKEQANALSDAVLEAFHDVLSELENEPLRVMIVTGAGERVFSAGADLKERARLSEEEVWPAVERIRRLAERMANVKVPTIAALNGAAFGGGLELALACDFRIAARDARLGLTETSLGIIPGAFGTARLARLIGTTNAMELVLAARRIDAAEAVRLGIVSKAADDAREEALSLAREIARNAPLAVQIAKEVIGRGRELPLFEAFELEKTGYLKTIKTEDRLEGLTAFREKRTPNFKGR